MQTLPVAFAGRWSIVETELWGLEFLDIEEPAQLKIGANGEGHFAFGAVTGQLSGCLETHGREERFEFTWSGFDEGDSVSGRGWACLSDGQLVGRIYFHLGDDSGFRANKNCVKEGSDGAE